MLATIALSYWVISSELEAQRLAYKPTPDGKLDAPAYHRQRSALWVKIFAYYCLLIHFLVFIFPLRSCWAVFTITRSLRKAARAKALRDIKFGHRRRGSSTSLSSSETLTSSRELSSTSSSEAGDLDPDCYADGDIAPDRVIHAIVIPNYKEENDTLRETLEVLASHPQARNTYDVSHCSLDPSPSLPGKCAAGQLFDAMDIDSRWSRTATEWSMIFRGLSPPCFTLFDNVPRADTRNQVYLAMEQREHNVETKAMMLVNEFSKKFRSIDFTVHPSDIPGELAGKGSNMAWAARKLSEKYTLAQRKDVIVTGIDGKLAPHHRRRGLDPPFQVGLCTSGFANPIMTNCSRQPPLDQLFRLGDHHAHGLS